MWTPLFHHGSLFKLGVILEANDLGERSRGVLAKLVHDYPDSRWRKEVLRGS